MNDGGRPAAAPPADVTVLIGGRELGTMRVSDGFKEYDVAIPAGPGRRGGGDRRAGARSLCEPPTGIREWCSARPTTATSASWSIAWR